MVSHPWLAQINIILLYVSAVGEAVSWGRIRNWDFTHFLRCGLWTLPLTQSILAPWSQATVANTGNINGKEESLPIPHVNEGMIMVFSEIGVIRKEASAVPVTSGSVHGTQLQRNSWGAGQRERPPEMDGKCFCGAHLQSVCPFKALTADSPQREIFSTWTLSLEEILFV